MTSNFAFKYRQLTWKQRALPDFIIIGAQKAGTSSLYYYLSQHPQLFAALQKEVKYFDTNFRKGLPWYHAHFPLKKAMGENGRVFEASPQYIFNPSSSRLIHDIVPRVKIVALLRNPADRAVSHYFHEKRRNREPLSIYEALEKEDARLKDVIEKEDYENEIFRYYSYKTRGLYKVQLERYLKYFSRDQILVLSSEGFFSQPDVCLKRVFEFVGVDRDYQVKDLSPKNVGSNRSIVESDVYDQLCNFFQPYNQELYELTGEDYCW